MTFVPPLPPAGVAVTEHHSARPTRSRSRRGLALTASITLAVLCSLLATSAGGNQGVGDPGVPGLFVGYVMIGVFAMIGVSVLLVWRHRIPVLVSMIATALTLLFPTTPLPALIALAAVTAATKGWRRWSLIGAAYAATVVAFYWDLTTHDSLLASLFGSPAQGTAARLVLFWMVPPLAALTVAPFAGFGIARRLRAERDAARYDSAAAHRTVSVLRHEVDQQNERQELARELHDTLAADLSQVALHAGALELTVDDTDERVASSARVVRESAQRSLDDLRRMVRSLRAQDRMFEEQRGLDDLPELIDDALRNGTDVRAQIMVTDTRECAARVAHAGFRIVQESISNVRRHAPGAVLYLDVRGSPAGGLGIRAANWLVPDAAPSRDGGGHGLQGMRERAQLLGGTFQAGATPEASFVITVWLPWNEV